ncbi:Antibiotic biosynthesis monooxygenase [Vibrio aerogenes CECT 7868]|uniref:Antibiotic biosynthesis monooxygenase n=1 Tax=Vibrio aerogenes CECT 7868 TaxID=1216006 RepID=A0A1M5ZS28_9VIBR|nr:antibiotic biosynthesis monooxygenase [Vibrio aerogenes]SHI27024.1 Antibiotic biosynthesis monooxygenase [Vibrio aerogenes CECT 7868]
MIAVLFEAKAVPEKQARYFDLAAQLKPLLSDVDGFISVERFHSVTDPHKFLSLSWWESEASIMQWKQNVLHQAAQHEGRDTIFSGYHIRVLNLIREYAFESAEPDHR